MGKTKIIAEIGINGVSRDKGKDIEKAGKLITIAALAGVDYVKFQKRNPDIAVPENKKSEEKRVPWRKDPTTYLQYKKDIEFGYRDYEYLFSVAKESGVKMFASVWDTDSANFMRDFTDTVKIPSAHLTNYDLLSYCNSLFKTKILSTGMSTEMEIENAVHVLKPQVLMHTNSTYPSPIEELNMKYIQWLRNKWPTKEIGYSNHYYGIIPSIASIYLGATWVEFHITLDHTDWGSDQAASIEPSGIFKLVKGIRDLEAAHKGYIPRDILPSERKKRKDLNPNA
jgi:N-acetylneuraminate synthase